MSATEYEFKAVEKFISNLTKSKKPPVKIGYTRTEILQKEKFRNAIRACKKKNFTDQEIMQAISKAVKDAGFEEGKKLQFSKKEIFALLEELDKEKNTTENINQDAPDTAAEGEDETGEKNGTENINQDTLDTASSSEGETEDGEQL